MNKILGGGLPRGHILEISGPPGSFKESLALDFVRTFVKADERVIFVGTHLVIPSTSRILTRRMLDMQGMTSPKAISGVLAGNSCTHLIQEHVDITSTDMTSPYSQELIRYARFHTLPDLLVFMHNLLAELHPTVSIVLQINTRIFAS